MIHVDAAIAGYNAYVTFITVISATKRLAKPQMAFGLRNFRYYCSNYADSVELYKINNSKNVILV